MMEINKQNFPELKKEQMEKIIGGSADDVPDRDRVSTTPDATIVYELAIAIRLAKAQGMSKEDSRRQWNATHTGAAVTTEVQLMIDRLWATL